MNNKEIHNNVDILYITYKGKKYYIINKITHIVHIYRTITKYI